MANEKLGVSHGDVLYIIGKYSFSRDEPPAVIEVQVAYNFRKRIHAYPTKGNGCFSFKQSDFGKLVFLTREEAEAALVEKEINDG